jgi:four helix bundle protein
MGLPMRCGKGKGPWANQFMRAAMSMTLIVADDQVVWNADERKEFFMSTRGSAVECVPFLDLCRQRNLIDEGNFKALKGDLDILARMLGALIKGREERMVLSGE